MSHNAYVMKQAVRHYLRDVKAKINAIKVLENEIALVRESMEGVSSPNTDTASSGTNDRMTNGVIRLHDLERQWHIAVAEYADIASMAYSLCFNHGINRQVVWLHEVERKNWEVIGHQIGYSARSTRRIAESGYKEIYHAMPELYRRNAFPNAAPI